MVPQDHVYTEDNCVKSDFKLVLNISDPRCHGRKSGICGWSCYTPDTLDTNILEPNNKMGASILENNKVGTMWVLSGLYFQHYLAHKDDVCCFQEAASVHVPFLYLVRTLSITCSLFSPSLTLPPCSLCPTRTYAFTGICTLLWIWKGLSGEGRK